MGNVNRSQLYLGIICSGLNEGLRGDLRNNRDCCAQKHDRGCDLTPRTARTTVDIIFGEFGGEHE